MLGIRPKVGRGKYLALAAVVASPFLLAVSCDTINPSVIGPKFAFVGVTDTITFYLGETFNITAEEALTQRPIPTFPSEICTVVPDGPMSNVATSGLAVNYILTPIAVGECDVFFASSQADYDNSVTLPVKILDHPQTEADTVEFTGPSSGLVNVESTDFEVAGPNITFDGLIEVRASGGGLDPENPISPKDGKFNIKPTSTGEVKLTATYLPYKNVSVDSDDYSFTLSSSRSASFVVGELTYFVTAPGQASSFTLTGPTGGSLNADSGDFSVSLIGGTYVGKVSINVQGAGLNETKELEFTSAGGTSQMFSIRPTAVGAVTLTPGATPALGTAPAALNYTVRDDRATSYALTGPTGGSVNADSGEFKVALDGPYAGKVSIAVQGGGLNTTKELDFTLTGGTSKVFSIRPTAAGTVTLTATASPELSANPRPLTYTATAVAATSYVITGPSGGRAEMESAPFTVTPNGVYTGKIYIGLSPLPNIVLQFNNSSEPQTFTITPGYAGSWWIYPKTDVGRQPALGTDPLALEYKATNPPATSPTTTFTYQYNTSGPGKIQGEASQSRLQYQPFAPVVAIPDACAHFVSWSDGSTQPRRRDVSDANKTITATFEGDPQRVSIAVLGQGSVSPGAQFANVECGNDATFEFKPDTGNQIQSVTIDGSWQGRVSSWTFKNVREAHTIEVAFESTTTTTRPGGGGSTCDPPNFIGDDGKCVTPDPT